MKRRLHAATALLGMALALAACGKSGSPSSSASHTPSRIVLLPKGNATYNSYDLAYQACSGRTAAEIAEQVGTTATDPAKVAAAFAANSFDAKGRPSATRGCLDALEGNPESPPPPPTASSTPSS